MSTFGSLFRVTTYGESHCKSVGCIVDGVPPGMELTEDDIQPQLTRRRPGQSRLTTPRDEKDRVAIQSGTEFGITLGTPIGMIVQNQDQRPHDYLETEIYPRPSHADWTYLEKYGVKASSGGGRASARETIGRVAAGAIAEKYLRITHNVEIVAFVSAVGTVGFNRTTEDETFRNLIDKVTRDDVDSSIVRCPVGDLADKMIDEVEKHRSAKDSIGGVVTCVIRNVPAGLGEPCFDKLEAQLAHAMLSIPATKGFEIGSGFAGTTIPGSKHNDPFIPAEKGAPILDAATKDGDISLLKDKPVLRTKTNNSGGIQGGISNGESIYFSVAFKPPATISQAQATSSYIGNVGTLEAKGRHDPNVVPRAVPIVEAMAALVLIDSCFVQQSRIASRILLPAVPLKGNAVALTAGKNSTK